MLGEQCIRLKLGPRRKRRAADTAGVRLIATAWSALDVANAGLTSVLGAPGASFYPLDAVNEQARPRLMQRQDLCLLAAVLTGSCTGSACCLGEWQGG